MRRASTPILAALMTGLCTAPAQAAEITLETSALQRLVMDSAFREQGRHYLRKGPCFGYLETPSVSVAGGRIQIRSHFTGRLGVVLGASCMGSGVTTWTTISAQPVAVGDRIVLKNLRFDAVGDTSTRELLQSGLFPALPAGMEFDMRKAVADMLKASPGPMRGTIRSFSLNSVAATGDKLSVQFDFSVVGR